MTSSARTVHDGTEPDLSRDEWARPTGRECEVPQEAAGPFRWLRRLPFRVRLTLSFAVVMIVLFGGLALLLQTQFSASLDQGINRSLHTHAADIASLVRGEKQLPQLPESGGAFAQIVDPATGLVLDYTPGHATPLLSPSQMRRAAAGSLLIDRGSNARLYAKQVATQPPAVVVVGSSLAQRNRALTVLSELLFIGGPLILVLTCLAGYVLAERALAPVGTMSARAARISGAPQGERLPVPEANDELRRLGETLNEMLSRLEDALARERALVADAGHELRTPLSILKLELELALASDISREELQTRVRSAAEEVDRLAQLAQDLLVIARAELGRLPLDKRRLEVRDVLSAVAERFAVPSAGTGRPVTVEESDGLTLDADPSRLEQALMNMVSNAMRYGDGAVVLRASRRGRATELHVLDDGRGFEPDFLSRAFERFSRADPARSGAGAGLGLSIVQVIAEAHGGHAYAANRQRGGADVWLALPSA
ncbi:MAG TPA: ATP-binding protein [Solirubrobacteraceae bacterium]|nr:ATP-binding protein [Solirubrobacteraceae bacterium]